MMCDARMWGGIEAMLGVPCIHHLPTEDDTISALAARFLADAPLSFALAGLSMGGIVAMEILRQAPDRVARLALLDTNPRAGIPAGHRPVGPHRLPGHWPGTWKGVMREDMKPNYLSPGPGMAAILSLCWT